MLRIAPVNLGAPELIIILLVVLLLFGGRKLPDLARSLGTAKKEFEAGQQAGQTGTPGTAAQGTVAAPPVQQTPDNR